MEGAFLEKVFKDWVSVASSCNANYVLDFPNRASDRVTSSVWVVSDNGSSDATSTTGIFVAVKATLTCTTKGFFTLDFPVKQGDGSFAQGEYRREQTDVRTFLDGAVKFCLPPPNLSDDRHVRKGWNVFFSDRRFWDPNSQSLQ
jgi:hypothetical protein